MNDNTWKMLRVLFENDNGTLPDIFVENLTDDQIVAVYRWVVEQTGVSGEPNLWSTTEEKDLPIKSVENPAQRFIEKKVEPFRHGLAELVVNGVKIPQLTVSVEVGGISFDYRMGKEWGRKEVEALFSFLSSIQEFAPESKIIHAYEGQYEKPNIEFSKAFERFWK